MNMRKSHDRFFTDASGKRTVLVVDDEFINRILLGNILESQYEVLFAENGKQALDILRERNRQISMVLLDLMMPEVNGFDVIQAMRADSNLLRIPIIVLTSEKQAEVESLHMGAYDFIQKPYDMPEVILARIARNIELAENNDILSNTERDELTGLLNREFFYGYVEEHDIHQPDAEMAAAVIDIDHFHLFNELYGWVNGDKVLSRMGSFLVDAAQKSGSIIGRQDADAFVIYAPISTDFPGLLRSLVEFMRQDECCAQLRIRMGINGPVDKSIEIKRRFDRAGQAADTIRGDYSKAIAWFDSALREKELLNMQLVGEMHEALEQRQFQVFFQPKYNIKGERPVLSSAEALIRWKHPKRGMISPGVFIPIFEENGLVSLMDRYMWRETARQIRAWQDKYSFTLPVSVNCSRVDLLAPDFVETMQAIIAETGLAPQNLLLEITESAYTENGEKLIEIINTMRKLGFLIEMDDFGSGYSSLNMLSQLPLDALKLDMMFAQHMGDSEKNKRVLKMMIEIAQYLAVPVIAEGVETEEQVRELKEMGCDLIQGYYFSRPVPAQEFERFIEEEIQKRC